MNTYTVYDAIGRKTKSVGSYVAQATLPNEWVWRDVGGVFAWRLSASNDSPVSHGANNDLNIISANTYDKAGRVIATRDTVGKLTQYTYDAIGRLMQTIVNYMDGVFDSNFPDQDIITTTTYNKAGQVINTTDPHSTVTEFAYDVAGRRVSITQAEGTTLETTSYTCFNKAGWVLRMIGNYIATSTLPDAKTGSAWDFNPTTHGTYNDENLITEYEFDQLGRQTKVINPLGEFTSTTYAKDGSVMTVTDQEGTVTAYRYDKLRRRRMVVQGYIANDEDPANWVWDATDERWEKTDMTDVEVEHGTDNDENIIVQLTYDIAGRTTEMRNPRGFITEYAYDALNRRIGMTNPLANVWETGYEELGNGGRRTIQTFPNGYDVTREFDRMGRLVMIDYGNPSTTPTVEFGYDVLGNRQTMEEIGASGIIRKTQFGYDSARRMTSVQFDTDGNGIINEVVSYKYDERGLRTRLTFDNGAKSLTYGYDAKGRLVSMTDWDSHTTTYDYDDMNRHRLTTRHNDVTSAYTHNMAGQLTDIHHKNSSNATLAHFSYTLNGRGHRIQANETLNGVDKTLTYSYDQLSRVKNAKYYSGTTPTGTPVDEYAYGFDLAGNRLSESHSVNGGTPAVTNYGYNSANRLTNTGYTYDNNGNLTSNSVSSYTWDRANRLKSVGTITYTYDGLGNRIQLFNQLSGSATDTTTYLPDMQGGLTEVLRASTNQWIYGNSSSITRTYVHEPRGLGAYYLEKSGMAYAGFIPRWMDTLEDGLGSIRAEINHISQVIAGTRTMNPYGDVMTDYNYGTMDSGYGFTGEQIDPNELVYLRARYYDPNIGTFTSLDPFEGVHNRPTSINGYSWVEGNVANWVDESGLCPSSETSPNDAQSCESMRTQLALDGVMTIYDDAIPLLLASLLCLPQESLEIPGEGKLIDQLKGGERWTLNEMTSIFNAFRIFKQAKATLNISYDFPLRSDKIIWLKKTESSVPESDYALTANNTRIIRFSPSRWGEAGSIANYTYVPDANQYRAWIVLHEFSHLFTLDHAKTIAPRIGFEASNLYVQVFLADEVYRLFRESVNYNKNPTDYPISRLTNVEYVIESVTGTLWNAGYTVVSGYVESAGGRTGAFEDPQISNEGNYANVRDIITQTGINEVIYDGRKLPLTPIEIGSSLEDWVISRLIRGE